MVYKPKQPDTQAVSAQELGLEREIATLSWNGKQHEIEKRRVVIGRSKDVDIQVEDPNVSRRHAEVRQEGAAYWVVDLDSTNGTEINGRRLKRAKLRAGGAITVGRGPQNDVALDGDDYASAKHARIEPRGDGVWVQDVGSTNGTYLNGIKLTRARKLTPGDVVRVGETELRYET